MQQSSMAIAYQGGGVRHPRAFRVQRMSTECGQSLPVVVKVLVVIMNEGLLL